MRNQGGRLGGAVVVAMALVALAGLGDAGAQDRVAPGAGEQAEQAKAKPDRARRALRKGGLRAGGGVPPKDVRGGVADPLDRAAAAKGAALKGGAAAPEWPFHVTFRLTGGDGVTLDAAFYPARGGADAPVLLLIHQTGPGHSRGDFEKPIEALQGQSLAEHLQQQDYAVLLIDLRGHGAGVRRQEVNRRDPRALATDLQTAYLFLIDRHNRRELNLAKFGVIAVGDGANLAAGWAAFADGAVANPGRPSDLAALVLVSPAAEAQGVRLAPALNALAPRLPLLLVAGDRDAELAKAAEPVLKRNRQSSVKLFETRLQGDRLLEFEPAAIKTILAFLDEPVKFRRNAEWEPRYLLQPIAYSDIQYVESRTDRDGERVEPAPAADRPAADQPKAPAAPEAGAR